MTRIFFYPDSTRYVLFTDQALAHMYAHTQRLPWHKEAGGELFSAAPDAAGLVVTSATGPNAGDRRNRYGWNPDTAASDLDRQMEFALGRHAVGLWHTHPEPSPSPSSLDRETTKEYLTAFNGQRSRYLMVIIGNRGKPPVMTVLSFSSGSGEWEVLKEMPSTDFPSLEQR